MASGCYFWNSDAMVVRGGRVSDEVPFTLPQAQECYNHLKKWYVKLKTELDSCGVPKDNRPDALRKANGYRKDLNDRLADAQRGDSAANALYWQDNGKIITDMLLNMSDWLNAADNG
jgi:hypothetical protein